jgi:hypothetical protein
MKRVKHWQDLANALLGAWLIASPWILGFEGVVVATVSTAALGVLLIASSIEAMQVPQAWEEWLDVALGLVLMALPVVLGFDANPAALQNALLTGSVVAILALWVLGTDDEFASWWERQAG